MENLPAELIGEILFHMKEEELLKMKNVNKTFYNESKLVYNKVSFFKDKKEEILKMIDESKKKYMKDIWLYYECRSFIRNNIKNNCFFFYSLLHFTILIKNILEYYFDGDVENHDEKVLLEIGKLKEIKDYMEFLDIGVHVDYSFSQVLDDSALVSIDLINEERHCKLSQSYHGFDKNHMNISFINYDVRVNRPKNNQLPF